MSTSPTSAIAIIHNTSTRPDPEVRALLEFALAETGGIEHGKIAIRVKDGDRGQGRASDAKQHGRRSWQGTARYGITLHIPPDEASWVYQHAWTYGQATARRNSEWAYASYRDAQYDQGVRRVGRWPLYRVHDWREHLVNLGAHELYHIVEYDRDRPGSSEVACELFAERVLTKYRLTNATALGMLLVPSMNEGGQAMSTAVAAEPQSASAAVTPNAVVVREGTASTAAKPDPKPSGTGKKVTPRRRTTKTTGEKPKRVSALAAAELILKRSKEPLHVNEITKRIQRMEGTNLKGKTPEASVGAILSVNLKQKDTPFKRTAPSTYTLKKK